MTRAFENALESIRSIASSSEGRVAKARQLVEAIRNFGDYRWVGVYDVRPDLVSIIAWSGPGAPERCHCGAAISAAELGAD